GGIDPPSCGRGNESIGWTRISGTSASLSLPVPPSGTLSLTPGGSINSTTGQTQNFSVEAMDGSGQPLANTQITLHVYGANGQDIKGTTDSAGQATLPLSSKNAGTDQVQALAFVSGMLTYSSVTSVTWTNPPAASGSGGGGSSGAPGPPPPSIASPTPEDGTVVSKPVPITAAISPASGQTIASWQVTYQAQDPEPPVVLAQGTGPPPATLATFDPTLVDNDTYVITVSATDSDGGTQSVSTTVAVTGNNKLGRYVTTYQDLSVPVNGFQMEVKRSYDSYDHRIGDFGYGWRVSLSNFRTSANRQLGAGGWAMYDTLCFGICTTAYRTTTPHYVTVTWPDGHQEVFDFTPTGGTNVFLDAHAAFTARPGTTSTLAVSGNADLQYAYDGNLYEGWGGPIFNPTRFKLTTQDGRVLILDVNTGLVSETDRSGNSLTVDSSGVHASNGESLTFSRDGQNRIAQITGPGGQLLRYGYDPTTGDLTSYTDADGNTVTYGYDANHRLLSATGPRSVPLVTLTYDSSGRVQSVQQGSSPPAQVQSNVDANQQTYTDPLGKLAIVDTFDNQGDLVQEDETYQDPSAGTRTLTWYWKYDAAGHPVFRQDPLGNQTSSLYDGNGNLIQVTNADHRTTQFTYNGNGQVTSEIGPGNTPLLSFVYDQYGNLTQVQRPDQTATIYSYDAAGRLIQVQDPLNRQTKYQYDSSGHLSQVQDPAGNITGFNVDASGKPLSIVDANGHTTQFKYDANGNVTDVYDGNNNHR
ncbi:MAG: Ig-like domain-containing protein, partial [Chloroflexi bacterium]|nr:Ig-like domain-containing protein [Chloroflexota bacterium]